MAVLTKATVQRLAVLRALSMWKRGAYGPVRVHKALFFADKDTGDPNWRLFTFKKWRLGQYSEEISAALNDLRDIGRVRTLYDGPSERIQADIPRGLDKKIAQFFRDYFPEWSHALVPAFRKWAYLRNDDIVEKAHDDPTYKTTEYGETIFQSFAPEAPEFEGLDSDLAEDLADFVDVTLHKGLRKRVAQAAERPLKHENWRKIYFGEEAAIA